MSKELQAEIVKSIANSISQNWDKITINVEIGDVCGAETLSEDGDVWLNGENEQVFLDYATETLFRQLRKIMGENDLASRYWTVCDLEISSDGRYNYQFSYHAPKRITELNSK